MSLIKSISSPLATAALLALAASASADVTHGPYVNPANGHAYYLANVDSYAEFLANAASVNGYPVVINNATENAWIVANVLNRGPSTSYYFIGLRDTVEEGSFTWDAGVVDTYTNWAASEPNNSTGGGAAGEDYVQINRSTGKWNDLRAPEIYVTPSTYGVIEVGGGTTGQPAGILAGPVCNPANGHLYYVTTDSKYAGAESFAQSLGGHIVTINDAAENEFVYRNVSALATGFAYVTIGLTDAVTESTFVWASGDTSGYRRWMPGEPNNFGGDEDYVDMGTPNAPVTEHGLWFDISDQARAAIIEVAPPVYCPGDFNKSGGVTVQDLFDFLAAFFAGCP